MEPTARGARDVIVDDLMLVPTMQLHRTNRYKRLDRMVRENPDIQLVSGHSLGGAVVSQWMQDNPNWHGVARIYDTPRLTITERDRRIHSYRHYGDVISMGDRAAEVTFGIPHSYS